MQPLRDATWDGHEPFHHGRFRAIIIDDRLSMVDNHYSGSGQADK